MAIIFQYPDLMSIAQFQNQRNRHWECDVPEFGEIFDYQSSAMVFNVVSACFLAAYAMIAIWAAAHADNRVVGNLQSA